MQTTAGASYNYYAANYGITQPGAYGPYLQRMPLYDAADMSISSLQHSYFATPADAPPGTTYAPPIVELQTPTAQIQRTVSAAQQMPEEPAKVSKVTFS